MNTSLWPKRSHLAWSLGVGLMLMAPCAWTQTPYWVEDDQWNIPNSPSQPVQPWQQEVEIKPEDPIVLTQTPTKPRHAVSVIYSNSSLSGGRGHWEELDTTYYYMLHPRVMGTARVDVRQRNGVTDTIQELGVEYYPQGRWQFRGHAARTANPDFTYKSAVGVGVSYYLNERVDLHLDAKRYHFDEGHITEIRPGVGVHVTPNTQVVGTYIQGDAYGQGNYQGGVVKVIHDTQQRHRWTISASSTVDPDRVENGVDFSRSKQVGVTYQFPVRQNVDVVVGAEHEWRDSYDRTGVMMGVVARW